MPASLVKSFATKTNTPLKEVERLWDKSKKIVDDGYPDIEKDSEQYYSLVVGILKKMLKIEESKFNTLYESIISKLEKFNEQT